MTLTLHLKPEVEAGLIKQAHASGMALEQYVLSVIEEVAVTLPSDGARHPDSKDAVRRMLEFGDKHRLSLGVPVTRKLLHEEHRF